MSFAFSQYFCREGAIWLACSSLLIRSSSKKSIGQISVSEGSVFNSACIWGLRCFSCNNVWVYKEVFTAICLFRSCSRLIRASARLVAPGLYIIINIYNHSGLVVMVTNNFIGLILSGVGCRDLGICFSNKPGP